MSGAYQQNLEMAFSAYSPIVSSSKSKSLYSFPKKERFVDDKAQSSMKYYNLKRIFEHNNS